MWCVFQPCARRRAPTVAPACAGTSVCVLWAGLEPAAAQVQQQISVELLGPPELDRSQAPWCYCFTLTCFLWLCARGNERFSWFLLNFIALAILFPLQLCASSPALTAVAVWGPISASVRLITAAHSAFCVSSQTTNTSGISYTPSAVWVTLGGVNSKTGFPLPRRLGSLLMDFYTQLYFFPCLFLQRSALLPVKTGEDASTSTNARVLLGGRGLVARQVRAHGLDAHLSCVSSHHRKAMVLLPVLTASVL